VAWYYVKSGGTATGDGGRYTTEKNNNSWASEFSATTEYYANVDAAMAATTPPTPSDVIYVSDASTDANAASITTTGGSNEASIGVYSVDDDAVQTYSAGATEGSTTAAGDYHLETAGLTMTFHGMTLRAGDELGCDVATASMELVDCTLEGHSAASEIRTTGDGSTIRMFNCIVDQQSGARTNTLRTNNGGFIGWYGGSGVVTGGSFVDVAGESGGNGGANFEVLGVDLSAYSTASSYLLGASGGNRISDDNITMRVDRCELNANMSFLEEPFTHPGQWMLVTQSSATASAAEYQFYYTDYAGEAEDQDDAGIHRNESTAFPGGEKVSIKVDTNANTNRASPFVFDLPSQFMALSTASTDTVRVYFAVVNTETLTDTNVWAELIYEDGTNGNQFNRVSNRGSDIVGAGTTHTDDSGGSDWRDGGIALTGHNEYYMDLDTSGDVAADCVPVLRIYVAEPSITVYFDTTIEPVA